MLSPIQLTPNMDMGTLVSAINDNFRQLESENRTKIIKDDNGVARMTIGKWEESQYGLLGTDESGIRRILLGQAPDDGRSGLWISKPTVDVITELGG